MDYESFDKIDFDPRVWGPKGWFLLETIVRSLPDDINEEIEKRIKKYFTLVAYVLPCTYCTKHMNEYIKSSDMINANFSRKSFVIKWLHDLHNNRLGKNKRTLEEVSNYYKKEYNVNNTDYMDLLFIFTAIVVVTLLLKHMLR